MSFTKAKSVNPNLFQLTNKFKMLKCKLVISNLQEQSVHVVFVDEFTVSARSFKPFTWSPIGAQSLCINKSDSFKCSFMVGLSDGRYYGVYGTNGTF